MVPQPCPGEALELNNFGRKATEIIKLESRLMGRKPCPGEALKLHNCGRFPTTIIMPSSLIIAVVFRPQLLSY